MAPPAKRSRFDVGPTGPPVPSVPPGPPAGPSKSAEDEEKSARLALLAAQIHARMINAKVGVPSAVGTSPAVGSQPQVKSSRPTPLILDSQGRTIDSSGKEVQLTQRMPTLKANIRAQKKEQVIKTSIQKGKHETESQFLDHDLQVKAPGRGKRSLKFNEKGTFEAIGQKLRTKAQLELLQKEIAENAKKTGISQAARMALLSSIVTTKETKEEDIPEVEWWDSFVMKDETYDEAINNPVELEEKFEGITHLIEHPIQMKPPNEGHKEVAVPVFLTKKEQKKLRRVNRREAWKNKQDNIRLGLEEPPEPKLKLSNMMRALGQQAIQDPTKIEAVVKEQMMRRQKAHEEANASRALTGEQKKAKKAAKIKEDTSLGVNVAVYRVLNLQNPAKKFKVEANIKQLQMSGVVVIYKNVNVIVTEGGPKQQKKFKKLMMSRIKWGEETADMGEHEEKGENKCLLVWEGMVKKRSFGEVKFKMSPNESFARELFKNRGVEQYWDLAFSMAILDSTES